MKFGLLLASLASLGHGQQSLRVPLEVTPGFVQAASTPIEVQAGTSGRLSARLPGGGELRLERIGAPVAGMIARIAGGDPQTLALLNDQFSQVALKRSIGHLDRVKYVLGYHRTERGGRTVEDLYWAPAYRAEGRLKLPGCELNLVLLDLNGDGIFDRQDSIRGTTIGLDVNNDGRIWGAAEWRAANEIIEVCGRPLEVAEIDPTGLAISFRDSELRPAVTGATVPSFTVITTK